IFILLHQLAEFHNDDFDPQQAPIHVTEPCKNQTIDELPQTLPGFDPTCYSGDGNSFTYDSKSNLADDSPNGFNPLPQPLTYSYEFCGNNAYYGHDCPPQQKKEEEEKQIAEEQAATARYRRIPICYDDDKDYTIVITPKEPEDSLRMGDEHLDTIPEKEVDEFIKSSVENLVPNPSESKDLSDSECDVPVCDDFITFSNLLFDVDDDFSSSDDESFYDEDISKEIYSNPLFDEEIISIKIDPHHFNAKFDLIESLINHDSSIISSSLKIDSLLDEFTAKEFNSENFDTAIKSFSPSPIPVEDSDSFMEEIDLSFTLDDLMPPGIEKDNYDSERDILILEELLSNDSLSLPKNESFHFDIPSSSRPPTKPSIGNS
nr:hypothetical protein [Tanacetum cinerariifolium]